MQSHGRVDAKAGHDERVVVDVLYSVCVVDGAVASSLAPPGAKMEAASPGRSRAQKRVVWS